MSPLDPGLRRDDGWQGGFGALPTTHGRTTAHGKGRDV